MAPKTVFITGSNRGIGLGIVKELLKIEQLEVLIAGARNVEKAEELQSLAKSDSRLHLISIDVSDDDSLLDAFSQISEIVENRGLNVLINNAAILEKYNSISTPNRKSVNRVLDVNATSGLLTCQIFLPLLQKANNTNTLSTDKAAIINIASDSASQALNIGSWGPMGLLSYQMSKVAMLSFARTLAADYKNWNIPVLVTCIHPGWVKTDMGGPDAEISVEESAEGVVNTILKLDASHAGALIDYKMEPIPF